MFESEDFEMSLESQLRLRVIEDEIRHCDNVKELQEQLIRVTKLFASYQQLLTKVTERLLKHEMDGLMGKDTMEEIIGIMKGNG